MRSFNALFHGLSLSACVVLGAGFWQLRGTLSARAPERMPSPVPASAQPASAEQAGGIQALAHEVESLRVRLHDLENRPLPATQASPSALSQPVAAAASPDGLLAALDDPKVQEKLRMLREDDVRKTFQMGPFNSMFGGMSLDDAKRQALEKLIAQSQNDISAAFRKLSTKEWTPDQVRNQTELARSNLDARVRPVLTEDQYRTYLERLTGMRQGVDQWLANQEAAARRPPRIR